MKIEKLKENLQKVRDPRRQYGNILHVVWEMLIIALCSVICLGEDYEDMEEFGKARESWLKEQLGLKLENGIASWHTFRRITERIKPEELRRNLNASLEVVRELREVIGFDGKTAGGSKSKKGSALHIISAFCTENQLVLGEKASGKAKTEKHEIPELVRSLDVAGAIMTTDSIGCYEKTVEAIVEGEADYVIGLKKNQPTLHGMVEKHFTTGVKVFAKEQSAESGHGRFEVREYYLETELDWLKSEYNWAGMRGIGMVRSCVLRDGKESKAAVRYYITSLDNVDEFAYAVRSHWGIENNLHWCLDVIFREDSCKVKNHNAALNLNILRKTALQMVNEADMGKISKRKKMRRAAMNPDALLSVILCGE
jgi:predicted transposase YbfD/YdcC